MKKIYLRLSLLIGTSFAILCGCQKEEMPTNSEFASISRLESEKMLEKWNTERKNKLKSSFSLKIAEEQWRRAKVYLNKDENLSFISVPLTNRVAICFARKKDQTEISFCETRPDKNYLEKNNGKVFFKTLTGYLIFYNKDGKGLNALRYVNGKYDGIYEVIPKKTKLKGLFDMNFTEEVVIYGKRKSRDPEFTIVQNEDLINERPVYDPRYERVCVDDGGGSTGSSEPEEPDTYCSSNEESNTEFVISDSSPEPKWGQLGDLSDINKEFNKVRSKNLTFDNLKLQNQLELLQKHFEGNRSFTRDSNNKIIDDRERDGYAAVDRYIFTTEGGWIDLNHFFTTAALAEKTCLRTAIAYTNMGELIQDMKGSPSAYSYEDLPSNRFGAEFWLQYHNDIKQGKMSVIDAANVFLRNLNATEPEFAPNYSYIPHIVDGKVPKNTTSNPLLGESLAKAAQSEYCKRDKKTKEAIREAHNSIPHSSNKIK